MCVSSFFFRKISLRLQSKNEYPLEIVIVAHIFFDEILSLTESSEGTRGQFFEQIKCRIKNLTHT